MVKLTDTENLIECAVCGSTEFCMTQEFKHSFTWIRCRQCDKVYGLADKTKPEGDNAWRFKSK